MSIGGPVALVRIAGILGEKDGTRVLGEGGYEEDALTALGHASESGVHESVCPPVAESFELLDEVKHGLSLVEHQHVPHVFKHEPARVVLLEQTEDVRHEAGLLSRDASGTTSLREVLARESCRHERLRRRAEP
ncbi:hypothetical protein RB201_19985 [Streptomyces sp. S1A(2023)]